MNWFYCDLTEQKDIITSPKRKLGHFDSNIIVLGYYIALANHVTDKLQEKLDVSKQVFSKFIPGY